MMNKSELTAYRDDLAKEIKKAELGAERVAHDLRAKRGMLKLVEKQLELMPENGKEEKEEQ